MLPIPIPVLLLFVLVLIHFFLQPSAKGEFEHELEVEVSAAEIRRQGQLAMAGDPSNQYEDLVKGLLDNIRILARAVPG